MSLRPWLLLAVAVLVLAWAWSRRQGEGDVAPPPAAAADTRPAAPRPAPVPNPSGIPAQGRLPGVPAPTLATATPAEVAALQDAEVANSARSAPVATYKDAQGRTRAFDYSGTAGATPRERAAEEARDRRREDLRRQAEADPAGFAERHGLSGREVERIVDGSLEVPERLL